jgi:formylglycine-generating enzyme required for sulfatase activity
MALASLRGDRAAPQDDSLREAASFLASQLIDELLTYPDRYQVWMSAMRPARSLLISPLEAVFRDAKRMDSVRSLAATMLAIFAGDDPETLTELLLDANARQFAVILHALARHRTTVSEKLGRLLESPPGSDLAPEARILATSRQANATIGLLHCGDPDSLWRRLRHSGDPLLRTYLIDRLPRLTPDPSLLVRRLDEEDDVSARRALILILGGMPASLRSASWAGPAAERLLALYETDPDGGIHSATEWALQKWGLGDRPAEAGRRLAEGKAPEGRSWYITRTGHTMVTLRGPVTFRMGSRDGEPVHDSDERSVTRLIPRSFSIGTKEVSNEQVLRSDPDPDLAKRLLNDVSPDRNGTANVITWLDAVRYCRWLSDQEKIPNDQMCYPPLAEIEEGMKPYPDYLTRTGFRLPTEAEWEYACRARAITSRFFGDDPEMLSRYAWFIKNSDGLIWTGGRLLPNDFGLFDVLGNVKELCHDSYREDPTDGPDREELAPAVAAISRVARGNSYADRAPALRDANRFSAQLNLRNFSMGFRVARTVPAPR